MDIVALRREGWTIGQIADSTGKHPVTISSWLKKGGPPPRRQPPAGRVAVVDDRWAARVAGLLEANPELLATSIERIVAAEGYEGSCESLVRHLRVVRGVRRRRSAGVSVMIETAPGAEFQFDWSECGDLNLPLRPDTPQRRRRTGGFVTRSQGLGCPRGALMAQPSELSTGVVERSSNLAICDQRKSRSGSPEVAVERVVASVLKTVHQPG